MYGDPGAVHGLARQVRAHAHEVRGVARSTQHAAGVEWESAMARRYSERVTDRVRRVAAAADQADDVAAALDAHARAVQARLDQIASAGRFLDALLDRATHDLRWAADRLADGADAAAEQAADRARSLLSAVRRAPGAGTAELLGFAQRLGFGG